MKFPKITLKSVFITLVIAIFLISTIPQLWFYTTKRHDVLCDVRRIHATFNMSQNLPLKQNDFYIYDTATINQLCQLMLNADFEPTPASGGTKPLHLLLELETSNDIWLVRYGLDESMKAKIHFTGKNVGLGVYMDTLTYKIILPIAEQYLGYSPFVSRQELP